VLAQAELEVVYSRAPLSEGASEISRRPPSARKINKGSNGFPPPSPFNRRLLLPRGGSGNHLPLILKPTLQTFQLGAGTQDNVLLSAIAVLGFVT
jgi:hypothetical protein